MELLRLKLIEDENCLDGIFDMKQWSSKTGITEPGFQMSRGYNIILKDTNSITKGRQMLDLVSGGQNCCYVTDMQSFGYYVTSKGTKLIYKVKEEEKVV